MQCKLSSHVKKIYKKITDEENGFTETFVMQEHYYNNIYMYKTYNVYIYCTYQPIYYLIFSLHERGKCMLNLIVMIHAAIVFLCFSGILH